MAQRRRVVGVGPIAVLVAVILVATASPAPGQETPRARDLGVPFDGTPGPLNAITDVAGVEVGHVTVIEGEGETVIGEGPVRTGVTVVWPRGKSNWTPVFAGWFSQNGNGEMTGTTWVEESGLLEGPVAITNTLSVGIVHHAVIKWGIRRSADAEMYPPDYAALPVVAETWDGGLNDILGQHLTEEHAFAALEDARGGPVLEGAVGGGTGMVCHDFKGGIGSASRVVEIDGETYTLGVLVQCNYGDRARLRIAGAPVGREIPDRMPSLPDGSPVWAADGTPNPALDPRTFGRTPVAAGPQQDADRGSIIVVVMTDAPLVSHQLKRLARRVGMGLARNGSISSNGSGDIFIAGSTANEQAAGNRDGTAPLRMLANDRMSPLFAATIEATEESIVNALVAAETMTGADGITVHALPHDRLREALRKYNLLKEEP